MDTRDDKDAAAALGHSAYASLQSPVAQPWWEQQDDTSNNHASDAHALEIVGITDSNARAAAHTASRTRSSVSLVSIRTLFAYADRTDAVLMTAGTLGALAAGLGQPIQIVLLGKVFNAFNPMALPDAHELRANVNAVALNFVWVGLAMVFGGFVQVACWSLTGARQAKRIRSAYVRAVLTKDIGWFDVHDPMQLATRVADATVAIQDGMGRKVGDGLHLVAMGVAGIVIGLVKGWELTLVLLAFAPLLAVTAAVTIRFVATATQRSIASYSAAGAVAHEALEHIRTVHVFNAITHFRDQYAAALERSTHEGIRKGLALGWGTGVMFFVIYCAYAAGLYYGALQISHDQLRRDGVATCIATSSCYDGGKVMSIFFAVMMGAMALGQAGPSVQAIYAARASAHDVFRIIHGASRVDPLDDDGRILTHVAGEIAFHDVTFAYPSRPDVPVCRNYSLTVRAGETVALVGPSGSGKSTVVALLERFYDPQHGRVTLDSVDIRDLNVKWLRQQIGLVGQEPVLFATSILENIRHGRPSATDAEVLDAAKRANALEFVQAFPSGFATVVGERGTQLSGGQKQRIALARALVKQPTVLLLDEATSALDAESERVVQASLDALVATATRMTIIVIAHRLSTIQGASRIAVHRDGQIVEIGTHHELLLLPDGHYHRYVKAQQSHSAGPDGSSQFSESDASNHAVDASGRARTVSSLKSTDDDVSSRLLAPDTTASGTDADSHAHDKVIPAPATEDAVDQSDDSDIDDRVSSWRIWRLSRPEWKFFALGGVGAIVNAAVFPAWGVILTKIVVLLFDYTKTPSELRDDARRWALSFLALGVVFGASIVMQHFGFAVAAQRLVARVRRETFGAMLQQDMSWFDQDEHASGALVTRLATDSAVLQALTSEALNQGLVNATTLGIALAICFYASWQMSLAMLATFPLVLLFSLVLSQQHAGTLSARSSSSDADIAAGALLSEAIASIRTVASFSMEAPIHAAYVALLDATKRTDARTGVSSGALFGLSQGGMYMSIAFLFWLGAKWVSNRTITFEDMFMVQIVLVLSTFAVGLAAQNVTDRSRAAEAAANVFRVIDRVPAIDSMSVDDGFVPEPSAPSEPSRLSGAIAFDNVAFAYPSRPHAAVYTHYSLRIEPGQTVALVGPSGGGKSTAIALLERFYDPSAGRVTIDGRDVRTYNLAWLRSRIALVSQEPVLFAGTIAENIAMGTSSSTSVSRAAIVQAAEQANAHGFISAFPMSYDTRVGDRGAQVSGGQKQRIAIARAILRDPDILLLDEATSALDSESERLVQQSLDALLALKKRTTLVVAHRLSTVRSADVIAVTQSGRVVEVGSHDELMAPSSLGIYRTLVARQLQQSVEQTRVDGDRSSSA